MKQYLRKQYSKNYCFSVADVEHSCLLSPSIESKKDDQLIRKVLEFILQKRVLPTTTFDFDIFYFVTATVIMLLDERDTPLG